MLAALDVGLPDGPADALGQDVGRPDLDLDADAGRVCA